ncbi:unnamed protein product [Polarella glacialis]|uniref:Uncharacterized protein n=1 Tax=Polarella glacialis TaxID=89957 RepID=A0A813E6R4_POLGL|nr:unnamed protein product [Polarella glacialis]
MRRTNVRRNGTSLPQRRRAASAHRPAPSAPRALPIPPSPTAGRMQQSSSWSQGPPQSLRPQSPPPPSRQVNGPVVQISQAPAGNALQDRVGALEAQMSSVASDIGIVKTQQSLISNKLDAFETKQDGATASILEQLQKMSQWMKNSESSPSSPPRKQTKGSGS